MLILPIINRDRVLNVNITINGAEKIKNNVKLVDTNASELLVNGNKFTKSLDNEEGYYEIAPFIRNNSVRVGTNFYTTTDNINDTNKYDVYEFKTTPLRVNREMDNLYGRVFENYRKEVPNTNKGKYLSFKKAGLDNFITEEKVSIIESVVRSNIPVDRWFTIFEEEGVMDIINAINFLQENFTCTVVGNSTIRESSLKESIKGLSLINTRDSKNLNNYYETARENKKIYDMLTYVCKLVYGEPLGLILSDRQRKEMNK